MATWTPPNPKYPPPKNGEPRLFAAARVGDHAAIERLAASGDDVNAEFDMGLDPGARPDPCTPLMVAAGSGDGATVETVRLLLALGADPCRVTATGSAASRACAGMGWNYRPGGDAERLRELIRAGSPLTLSGSKGASLVADVARAGDAERLRVLLDAGAPVGPVFDAAEARQKYEGICGFPPTVAECGVDCIDEEMKEIARGMFEEMREQLASAPSSYEVPLMGAAESGNPVCVELLLSAGAPVATIDNMGLNALFHAGSPGVVRVLVEAGIDRAHTDDRGKDALQYVLEEMGQDGRDPRAAAEICGAMVRCGLPLFVRSEDRHRLYDAAFAENALGVRWLIEAGHGPEPRGDGSTALHAICWHWDHGDERDEATRDIVRALIAAGVDPRARDAYGNTPLHLAVAGDGTNLVAAVELLNAGADINALNDDGQTPLVFFYETLFDYSRVVPFLLEHGANPLIPNARGKNAIDIARQMIAGENPDWRTEQWAQEGGAPCGWKEPAEDGDDEYRMLELLIRAAERFGAS